VLQQSIDTSTKHSFLCPAYARKIGRRDAFTRVSDHVATLIGAREGAAVIPLRGLAGVPDGFKAALVFSTFAPVEFRVLAPVLAWLDLGASRTFPARLGPSRQMSEPE
jgi:hypothetical protein